MHNIIETDPLCVPYRSILLSVWNRIEKNTKNTPRCLPIIAISILVSTGRTWRKNVWARVREFANWFNSSSLRAPSATGWEHATHLPRSLSCRAVSALFYPSPSLHIYLLLGPGTTINRTGRGALVWEPRPMRRMFVSRAQQTLRGGGYIFFQLDQARRTRRSV